MHLQSLDGNNVLDVTAISAGTLRNALRLEVSFNTAQPDESFNLNVIQEDGGVGPVHGAVIESLRQHADRDRRGHGHEVPGDRALGEVAHGDCRKSTMLTDRRCRRPTTIDQGDHT